MMKEVYPKEEGVVIMAAVSFFMVEKFSYGVSNRSTVEEKI